jgi:predicted acylesterase/phospholipase RssA
MAKKAVQRALVLQGGGALGAYEAGVIKALAKKLTEEDDRNGYGGARPLFDIVAGASIGAINGALLVCHVLNRMREKPRPSNSECWLDAVGRLEKFWKQEVANYTALDNPWLKAGMGWWYDSARLAGKNASEYWKNLFNVYSKQLEFRKSWPFLWWFFAWPDNYSPVASGEAARRYFSYLNASVSSGIPGVLSAGIPQPADMKFLNPASPVFWRFDNSPAALTIKSHWLRDGPYIKTQEGEPRLLLVAVDVQDCTTAVTFDSYPKQGGRRYSEYGGDKGRNVIEYDGIAVDHVLASMSTHQRYEFPSMETVEGERRYFWDGAYLSNTPLREVLQLHRDYWGKVRPGGEIPDLEVYIINLYPSLEAEVPQEPDSIQDREIDIKFHDRTKYDLKVAQVATDYIDLANDLIKLAKENRLSEKVQAILDKPAKSKKRDGTQRRYSDLLDGRFSIERAVYVEREDDRDTIFGKAFDFSGSTITDLFEKGVAAGNKAFEQSRG